MNKTKVYENKNKALKALSNKLNKVEMKRLKRKLEILGELANPPAWTSEDQQLLEESMYDMALEDEEQYWPPLLPPNEGIDFRTQS